MPDVGIHESGFHGSRKWKGQQGEMCLLSFSFCIFYLTKKEEKNVLPENEFCKNKHQQNQLTLQSLTSPRHRWTVWPPKETQQCPLLIQAKFTWFTWEEKWSNALQKVQIKRDAVTFTGELHTGTSNLRIFVWGCEISTTEINLLGRIKTTPVFGKEKAHLLCPLCLLWVVNSLVIVKMAVAGQTVLEDGTKKRCLFSSF